MTLDNFYIILMVLAVVIVVLTGAFIALYFLNRDIDQAGPIEPGKEPGTISNKDQGG
jgi:uncharacterized protein YneF (UPF0154 family)